MADIILDCDSYNFILDASDSSATINSGSTITLNAISKVILAGAIQFSSLASGLVSLDASGNLSSVAGSPFNPASSYSPSGTWTFSNTVTLNGSVVAGGAVQINNTLGVTGALTAAGSIVNSGITSQSPSIGVPAIVPPAGFRYCVVDNTTGRLYKLG